VLNHQLNKRFWLSRSSHFKGNINTKCWMSLWWVSGRQKNCWMIKKVFLRLYFWPFFFFGTKRNFFLWGWRGEFLDDFLSGWNIQCLGSKLPQTFCLFLVMFFFLQLSPSCAFADYRNDILIRRKCR
jgi:hypothetical protein